MSFTNSQEASKVAELFGVSDKDFLGVDPFAHWFDQEKDLTGKLMG